MGPLFSFPAVWESDVSVPDRVHFLHRCTSQRIEYMQRSAGWLSHPLACRVAQEGHHVATCRGSCVDIPHPGSSSPGSIHSLLSPTRPCSRPLQAVPRTWLTGEGILLDAARSHVNLHDGQNEQDTCVGYAVCEVGRRRRARIDGDRSWRRSWLMVADGGCCGLLLCYETA